MDGSPPPTALGMDSLLQVLPADVRVETESLLALAMSRGIRADSGHEGRILALLAGFLARYLRAAWLSAWARHVAPVLGADDDSDDMPPPMAVAREHVRRLVAAAAAGPAPARLDRALQDAMLALAQQGLLVSASDGPDVDGTAVAFRVASCTRQALLEGADAANQGPVALTRFLAGLWQRYAQTLDAAEVPDVSGWQRIAGEATPDTATSVALTSRLLGAVTGFPALAKAVHAALVSMEGGFAVDALSPLCVEILQALVREAHPGFAVVAVRDVTLIVAWQTMALTSLSLFEDLHQVLTAIGTPPSGRVAASLSPIARREAHDLVAAGLTLISLPWFSVSGPVIGGPGSIGVDQRESRP